MFDYSIFRHYSMGINASDINNNDIFRILSLCLQNKNIVYVLTEVRTLLCEELPTYKILPIIPQLVPHITNEACDTFGQLINEIVGTHIPHLKLAYIVEVYLLMNIFLQ